MRDDAKKPLVIGEVLSPGLIEIYDLVDSSGSMNDSVGGITKYQAAVNGVRTKMTELLKDPNATYLFSGVEFGSYWEEHHRTWGNRSEGKKGLVFETRYWRTAADSSLANKFSYLASGTALNDSIVKLLRDIKAAAPKGKVIVNLITDGGEYHSKVFTDKNVYDEIKACEALGWAITFIGTEQDVLTAQNKYGVDASNTLGYDGTAAGLSMSMFSNIGATMSYSKAMMDGADEQELTRGFYSRS